eukprot:gene4583-4837_t
MLKEPRAEERFEVVWHKGGGRYDVLDTAVFSYQELLPLLTDEFVCTQNTPAMVSELLIPLQEKNWEVTPQEYERLKQQVHRQGKRVAEQIKAAAAFLEKNIVEANIQQYGEDFYNKPNGAKPVKRPPQQTEKHVQPGKKLKQGHGSNDAIVPAAAAPPGTPAAQGDAAAGKGGTSQLAELAAGAAIAAKNKSKMLKAQPAAARKTAAAPKAVQVPPTTAIASKRQQVKQQQRKATPVQSVAARDSGDEFVDQDEDQEDDTDADEAATPSESEEEADTDDFDDSDDIEMEQQEQPCRLQPTRAAQQQQKSKSQQQDTPAAAAKKRRCVAEAADADIEGASDQEVPETRAKGRKQQQQQTPSGKGKAAAVAEPGKARAKQGKQPAAAATVPAAARQGAAARYKGWTGRLYPPHLAYQPGDHRLGSPEYDSGYSQDTEYTVDVVLDEVEAKIGSRKAVKVLVKWRGFELDVNAWEPAENFSETEAYIKWKSHQKPAFYSGEVAAGVLVEQMMFAGGSSPEGGFCQCSA